MTNISIKCLEVTDNGNGSFTQRVAGQSSDGTRLEATIVTSGAALYAVDQTASITLN